MCRLAEEGQDFEPMYKWVKEITEHYISASKDFDVELRNMIAICFRNCIGKQTGAVKILDALSRSKKYKKYGLTLPDFKKKHIYFIKERSLEIAYLSAEKLAKLSKDQESLVFW